MGLAFHGLDGAISAEVLRMAEGDVPGAAERGESEAQGRHGGPGGPEGAWHGLLPTRSGRPRGGSCAGAVGEWTAGLWRTWGRSRCLLVTGRGRATYPQDMSRERRSRYGVLVLLPL